MGAQIEKIHSDERKFVARCDLFKYLLTCTLIAILGWHAIDMLTAALQAKPATLNAFARCLKEWPIMNVLLSLITAMAGGGWYIEYRRNNKLVIRIGKLRHELEQHDPINERSGLDETGATPKPSKRRAI